MCLTFTREARAILHGGGRQLLFGKNSSGTLNLEALDVSEAAIPANVNLSLSGL